VFQTERRSFIWKISYFCERTSRSFFRGLLGSGVGHEIVLSEECSPEDKLSEFGGVVGRSSKIEGSDQDLYFFSKKNINTEM